MIKNDPGLNLDGGENLSVNPESDIDFELAVLGLAGLYRTEKLAESCGGKAAIGFKEQRKFIAHQCPSMEELNGYIEMYTGTSHEPFLNSLLC
jgi:hypothetical protein